MVINNGTTIDPELLSRLEKELAALDYTVPDRTQTIKDILKSHEDSLLASW